MQQLWSFITDFFINLGAMWNWLNTPLKDMVDIDLGDLGDMQPIALIGIGGISILVVFWVIHLIKFW